MIKILLWLVPLLVIPVSYVFCRYVPLRKARYYLYAVVLIAAFFLNLFQISFWNELFERAGGRDRGGRLPGPCSGACTACDYAPLCGDYRVCAVRVRPFRLHGGFCRRVWRARSRADEGTFGSRLARAGGRNARVPHDRLRGRIILC